MLVKFGAIVTSGSGSLGGHTIQHSKGGNQLRTKPIPSGKCSESQQSIRSINPLLQAGWRQLTDAQRSIWDRYAQDYGIMNAHGDKRPLSGHSLWMKYNFEYAIRSAPFITDPALMGPPFLGSELISGNLDFSSWYGVFPYECPYKWGLTGTVNSNNYFTSALPGLNLISNGTTNFYIYILPPYPMTIGLSYRFSVFVSSIIGSFKIGDAGSNEKNVSALGLTIFDFVASSSFVIIQRYPDVANVVVSSVSLKRIY